MPFVKLVNRLLTRDAPAPGRAAPSAAVPARPSGWFRRYAVHATATFFGRTVEETFSRRGRVVVIGPSDAMSIPVPEGMAWVAKVAWISGHEVEVIDGSGGAHRLGPDEALSITAGDVALDMRLVPQFWLPRVGVLPWGMSAGWMAIVLVATVGVQSLGAARDVGDQYECPVLAKAVEYTPLFQAMIERDCMPPQGHNGVSDVVTAEYIARLLRKDYAGDDNGHLTPNLGKADKAVKSFYLPAGDKGPATEMGGSDQVGPETIRSQGTGGAVAAADATPLAAAKGAPVAKQRDRKPAEQASAANDVANQGENGNAAQEKKQGWGVRDWYDAADARHDQSEIAEMLRYSQTRLRIDPNDTGALSVLSYYQYLGQDYDSALQTYDKIIELTPESSAGYNNKALVYKREKRYPEEEALYRIALALEPDDPTALNNLAVNLSHQHRFPEALAIMDRLQVLDPADPYADLHRAKIQAEMGNDEKSCQYLEKALAGMAALDTLHLIEFRQDIRVDPSFEKLRSDPKFNAILMRYYGKDTPLQP